MPRSRIKISEDEILEEKESFNTRAREKRSDPRTGPREFDIMEEYYWPLTTFGERGTLGFRCNNKYYFYKRHLDHLKQFEGKRALNVACGTGELSLYLAHCGLDVVAFDYAEESVLYARELAEINGYASRIHVDLEDIRFLSYESESFDIVTGESALHHVIKYENCLEGLYRVLKPGGVAIFWDNFAFDPFIQALRPINWYLRGWPGEYSLRREDIRYAESVFDKVEITDRRVLYTYSRFFSKPSPFNRKMTKFLLRSDDRMQSMLPFLKRFFSLAYVQMRKAPM